MKQSPNYQINEVLYLVSVKINAYTLSLLTYTFSLWTCKKIFKRHVFFLSKPSLFLQMNVQYRFDISLDDQTLVLIVCSFGF